MSHPLSEIITSIPRFGPQHPAADPQITPDTQNSRV